MSTTPKIGRTGEVETDREFFARNDQVAGQGVVTERRNVIGADQVAVAGPDARLHDNRVSDQVQIAQTGTSHKLALGQIVIYRHEDTAKADCAAVITHVHHDGSLNLKLLEDSPETEWKERVFSGHGPSSWHHRGEVYVPTFNLDGTDRIRPTPFDAHEQIVRGPHTHSLDGGYRTAGALEGEYVPQEFPKVVDVNEETGDPVISHGPDDKVHADADKKQADEARAARERNQANRAPYETPATLRDVGGEGARLGETPEQYQARILKYEREGSEREESASREGGPQLGKRAAKQV